MARASSSFRSRTVDRRMVPSPIVARFSDEELIIGFETLPSCRKQGQEGFPRDPASISVRVVERSPLSPRTSFLAESRVLPRFARLSRGDQRSRFVRASSEGASSVANASARSGPESTATSSIPHVPRLCVPRLCVPRLWGVGAADGLSPRLRGGRVPRLFLTFHAFLWPRTAKAFRAYSSIGQSPRLITGLFLVRTQVGPHHRRRWSPTDSWSPTDQWASGANASVSD